jgi:predicted metal-dependent hydrolase
MPKIIFNGEELEYEIEESKRASRMRLCIFCGGNIKVTIPLGFPYGKIEKFIIKHSGWILKKMKIMKKKKFNPIFHKSSKREYKRLKEEVLKLAKNKTEEYNKIYGFSYNRISVRNSRSRWGSCSAKKNLNFNYKIIFLPADLLDYIIVHELCHLGEMNHSKRFWNLVEKTIPNYKEARKKIRNI